MFENKKLSESELASVAGGKRVAASITSISERKTHGVAGVDVGGFGPAADRLKDKERMKDQDQLPIYLPTTN